MLAGKQRGRTHTDRLITILRSLNGEMKRSKIVTNTSTRRLDGAGSLSAHAVGEAETCSKQVIAPGAARRYAPPPPMEVRLALAGTSG